VEEVGLSKAVFWKNTTGASAPVFFAASAVSPNLRAAPGM